jgi:hypothetical protein
VYRATDRSLRCRLQFHGADLIAFDSSVIPPPLYVHPSSSCSPLRNEHTLLPTIDLHFDILLSVLTCLYLLQYCKGEQATIKTSSERVVVDDDDDSRYSSAFSPVAVVVLMMPSE